MSVFIDLKAREELSQKNCALYKDLIIKQANIWKRYLVNWQFKLCRDAGNLH